jgi:transcriptional regulator with XRE-family HTH domain
METATASRLRAARKRMGLSQEELARRTGVPRTTLRDAELRLHVPRGDYVARLYQYVGLDLDDVLHDFEAKRRPGKEVRPESAEAT